MKKNEDFVHCKSLKLDNSDNFFCTLYLEPEKDCDFLWCYAKEEKEKAIKVAMNFIAEEKDGEY